MAPPFTRLSLVEFRELVKAYSGPRTINAVHVHHTWRPNHAQFTGQSTIESMWRFHTQTQGWSDIAQHVSIDPDGFIWTGRPWAQPPASAAGFNGNRHAGPFMFEMIGDFDIGKDPFGGAQKEAALRVVAHLLDRFSIPIEAVRFHNEFSSKSCPGTAIDRKRFVEEVRQIRAAGGTPAAGMRGASPFPTDSHSLEQAKAAISMEFPARDDPDDAEPIEHDPDTDYGGREIELPPSAATTRSEGLSAEALARLRPYVINSSAGLFSDDGEFATRKEDVDAIFLQHLPAARDALPAERPLRIVFFAHGGLVSEESGLRIALDQVEWWRANGVYPIHFVWETGLLETIGQLLSTERGLAGRDLADHTIDPIIEALARRLGGPKIWGGMKRSAERGAAPDGATSYVVEKLAAFLKATKGVELHAVGHSAGSIFHSFFIPAAAAAGATFKSLALLAPAITMADYRGRLLPQMGKSIDKTAIFTMARDWERDDSCAHVYRKSLLYLIHHALEPAKETPLLGLEESLRSTPDVRNSFGLGGAPSKTGEVVFSKTVATEGSSASTSTTHGGFDNDAPTMNAVLLRVLNQSSGRPDKPFPDTARGSRSFPVASGLAALAPAMRERAMAMLPEPMMPMAPGYGAQRGGPAGDGRRRALCVGINAYPTAPLGGCVADAQAWSRTFDGLGFERPTVLLDAAATRLGILEALRGLIRGSRAGDVVAFQFAGHGTQLQDLDGDEPDSKDEAICPFDFASGAFIIDDDFAELFAAVPDGVNLTCFFDCCHSGTNTRLAVGVPHGAAGGARPRFMPATAAMETSHQQYRMSARGVRKDAYRHPDSMRQVVFSACLDREVAYEEGGQGDFTRRALPILANGGSLSHAAFQDAVVAAFGAQARQHPELDCAAAARGRLLLNPIGRAAATVAVGAGGGHVGGGVVDVAAALEALARWLRGRD